MKNCLILGFIFSLFISFQSQDENVPPSTESETILTEKVAPIYPGCVTFKGNNRALMQCFNEKIRANLSSYVNYVDQELSEKTVVALDGLVNKMVI